MKYTWFLFLSLILFSCYNDNEKEVAYDDDLIIPQEKFTEILTDIHLVEGVLNIEVNDNNLVIDSISREYFDVMMKKYDVTEIQFNTSMEYYTFHIQELDKILEQVITNLSVKESEVLEEAKKQSTDNK